MVQSGRRGKRRLVRGDDVGLSAPPARGRRKKPIELEDLFALRLPGSPAIAPDGKSCVVSLQRCDAEANKYYSDLYLVDTESGEARALTEGDYSDSQPLWSPNGQSLAFVSTREETAQVYLMPLGLGDSRKATDLSQGSIRLQEWSPDGTKLLFIYRPSPEEDTKEAAEERKRTHRSGPTRVIESALYRLDGQGFLSPTPPHLYVLDVESGTCEPLTRGKAYVGSAAWSPDGETIAWTSAPDPEHKPHDVRILVRSVGGGPTRTLATPLGPKGDLRWTPDGEHVLYAGYEEKKDEWGARNVHVWIVPSTGKGEARDTMPTLDQTCSPSTLSDCQGAPGLRSFHLSPDGESVDVLIAIEGATHLLRCPLDSGEPRTLLAGHVHTYGFSPEVGGRIIVTSQTPTEPGYVACVPTAPGARARVLWNPNAELVSTLALQMPEEMWMECAETGRRVQGWVLKPRGRASGPKCPMILMIHGGPHTQYGAGFFHEFQWLAGKGYVILFTNPVGSQGRGEAYLQGLRRRWGEADFPELMAFVDAVLERGYVDDRRMGVAGGSYGGYMTNWVVGNTTRFAAACTQRCVSNLVSFAGNSDFPMQPDAYFPGNAWSEPEGLWHMSPLRFMDQVRTPLLILHSEGDLRCNIEQSEEVFSALRMLRRKTRFVRFPREASHGLSRNGPPDLRRIRLQAIGEWFDEHLTRSDPKDRRGSAR